MLIMLSELESTHQSSNKQATATEALSVKTQEVLSQNLLLRSDVQRTNSSALAAELSSLKLDMASSELVVVKVRAPAPASYLTLHRITYRQPLRLTTKRR